MRALLAVLALLAVCASATAQLKEADLLEPERAFSFSAQAAEGAALVQFKIADGYYMYRDRFRFSAEGNDVRLGAPEFPRGMKHHDDFFGDMEIYRGEVRIRIPVQGGGRLDLKVVSQGCADVGVCYVPMESKATLRVAASGTDGSAPGSGLSLFASDVDIARLFQGGWLLVLGGFLVFGMLLTFTPCVLPMVPILSGIIAGEGTRLDKRRALVLSLTYVVSMAAVYAAAGIGAAYAGSLIAAYLQNVWVLGAFSLVFVALALSMFGFYELRLPQFLNDRLHAHQSELRGGRIASVAAMGALSAVIVSPCVSAPLAGALLEISRSGDVALGGAALFAMGLGMGVPLVAVGVSEGALLPKAGAWMDSVKKFFGIVLLGVALWIIAPALPAAAQMVGWAALLIGAAMALHAIDPLPPSASGWARTGKGVGIMALVCGIALLAGALAGSRDVLRPLAGMFGETAVPRLPWTRVASVQELDQQLASAGKPAMLDFYADWCVSCKEMEAFTFSDARVREKLGAMLLLQADVTQNTPAQRELLKRFALFGPPGTIFFDATGKEVPGVRVIGYQNPERFLRTLGAATR